MNFLKSIALITISFLFLSCGKNESKTKEVANKTSKNKPLSYVIDDFLVYNSHKELKKEFKYLSTGTKSNGNEKWVSSTVNTHPEDKHFFVSFYWKDKTNLKDLEYLEITNRKKIKWKTKSGISPNLTFKDYELLNKKPFKINKFDIYNEATVDWNGGALSNSKIVIKIQHPEGFLPRNLSKLRRQESMSSDAEIQSANFKVTTFMLFK